MIEVLFFSFAFSFGISVSGLTLALFRSKTIKAGRSASSPAVSSDGVLVILYERDLDPEFARGLGDFGIEKEIFDEEEDLGRRVFRDWNRPANQIVDRLRVADVAASAPIAAALVVALRLDGGRRRVGEIAVDRAVAVVHRTDKASRPALSLLALA